MMAPDKRTRRARRRAENEALAKVARFWRKPGSAERLGHDRPVNRQAARAFSGKR